MSAKPISLGTRRWVLGVAILCALPLVLIALGVEFGTDLGRGQQAVLSHTILEWTAFCAAIAVCTLAFVGYRIANEP